MNPTSCGFMLVCYDPARLLALVAEWLSEQHSFSMASSFSLVLLLSHFWLYICS